MPICEYQFKIHNHVIYSLQILKSGTVKEGVERYKNSELNASNDSNVPDHFGVQGGDTASRQGFGSDGTDQSSSFGIGMGGGRGMGCGRNKGMCGGKGMGRGMGMGGGRGMGHGTGMSSGNEFNYAKEQTISSEEELNILRKQSEELLRHAGDIQARINKLEKND